LNPKEAEVAYAETHVTKGVYRVLLKEFQIEANNPDYDLCDTGARHSTWNSGEADIKVAKYTLLETLVPISAFPFICSCGKVVSESEDKHCYLCEIQDWVSRDPEE